MVHGLWCAWCTHVVACEAPNLSPEGEEPSFEVILRGVREEPLVRPYPPAHFPFGVAGINEIAVSGIYIGQCNDEVGGAEVALDIPLQPALLCQSSVVWCRIEPQHSVRQALLQKLAKCWQEGLFGLSFNEEDDLHARPPIRPMRQTSSSEYSASHSSKSSVSAHVSRAIPSWSESITTTSEGLRKRTSLSE